MVKTERVNIPVLPASPWDTTEYICYLEGGFIASLLGLGGILKLYRMWDGTDEEIQNQMAQVERGLLALMGGCPPGIAGITTNKAGYMVSTDQNGNVTILGDTYTGGDIEKFPSEQPVDLPGDNICAGSRMLVDRVLGDVLFSLDQAQFMVDGFKTGSEGLSLLLKTVSFFRASMGELFDAWEEWVLAAASLGISTLKVAFGDPAVRDKMVENIFCATMDSPNHMLTEEIYFNSVSDLPLLETQSTKLAEFMRGFSVISSGDIFQTAKQWFLLGSLNEDNTCETEFACVEGWILEADLTVFDGGLDVLGGLLAGVYVPSVGWQATTQFGDGGYHRNCAIGAEFPEASYTGAGMDFNYDQGDMPSSTVDWHLTAGGFNFGVIDNLSPPPESPWNAVGSVQTGTFCGYIIPVGVSSVGDPGGQCTITKVRLYGTGLPPEIAGWNLIG